MPRAPESREGSHRFEEERSELRPGEAHVWSAVLDASEERCRELDGFLSPDENARAQRLLSGVHRRRWAAGRGILRSILSRYLSIPPAEIRFAYTDRGKPVLAGARDSRGIRFNLSHSDERFLFAATIGREIGVDIERVRASRFDQPVARRFFTPRERALLDATPEEEWAAAFFAIWTRKEACIKASGLGLAISLSSFDVSADASQPRVISSRGAGAGGEISWTLVDVETAPGYRGACAVETAPGYRAACAVEGRDLAIVCREFSL